MAMRFSPLASTRITPTIVDPAPVTTRSCSTPSSSQSARAPAPKASAPTAVKSVTRAPRRRAATAWFDPLPPWPVLNERPITVSPASGTRSVTSVSPTP